MSRSKFMIHAAVRRVFARHWIDMEKLSFGVHRDSVRIFGELLQLRRPDWESQNSIVELLQLEIVRIRGVSRVYFDLVNWRRNAYGVWIIRAKRKRRNDSTIEGKRD